MRRLVGTVGGLALSYLGAFAVVEGESPRDAALPTLVVVAVLAGLYLGLTSQWAIEKVPALRRLPGAWKPKKPQTKGIVYQGSTGKIRNPHVKGQHTGIEISDDSDVDIDNADIE